MRLETPRIRPLPPEEWNEEAKDAFASLGAGPNAMPALNAPNIP